MTDKYSQYKRKESKGKIKARKTKEEEGKKVAMAAVGGMEAEVTARRLLLEEHRGLLKGTFLEDPCAARSRLYRRRFLQ